jgi:hypothetical protein
VGDEAQVWQRVPVGEEAQYDKREQYDQVADGLLEGERLLAVYDCRGLGAGFVAVTSTRIVYQDKSAFGGRSAAVSVPYSRVTSVAFAMDKNLLTRNTSTVRVTHSGGAIDAEFWGHDKARYVHDTVLWHITRG